MTAEELWNEFCRENPDCAGEDYEAWAFGGDPDGLLALVLAGTKTATASAYDAYGPGEPLPQEGEYSVILDSRENAVCVIRTDGISLVPFSRVTAEHAWREGEGDRSLAYWREVHRDFFTRELAEAGLPFTTDMLVVCETFTLVYPGAKL